MTARTTRCLALAAWAAAALACALPARAQTEPDLAARRAERVQEQERIARELTLSEERVAEIEAGIEAIRKDGASLSAALVQAAKTERKLSQDARDIAGRLAGLREQEEGLRASLAERRGVLAEVLGALQRMGLNPPPAILVRPEDALSSVRSSILLAAVVPELRGETAVLIGDLRELSRIVATIDAEQRRLLATVEEQVAEQRRLSLLLEEKQKLQVESQEMLAAEKTRAAELAAQATSLRELIDALDSEIEIAALARERAAADEEAVRKAERRPLSSNSIPFSAMQGQVALPVAGRIEIRFGQKDGSGGTMQGDMLATHSAAIVTAPVDGAILYAGPFRSFGQLLILDAGEGYHIVLAGMDRISVAPGQSVLAGEPVGMMGEARVASAVAFGDASAGPELYVEFWKGGKPVDPSPWWAENSSGRTGNDT